MAHQGRATSDVSYDPEAGPEAYSNPSIHRRLSDYTATAKEIHGPDFDPAAHDIDGRIAMIAGGGKKHGRYYVGHSVIDSATTPTLSQIKATATSSSPAIRPRPSSTQHEVQALRAQLEEQARLIEERERAHEEQMRAQAAQLQAQLQAQMQEHIQAQARAQAQQMQEMLQYVQSIGQHVGHQAPPPAFVFPPAPTFSFAWPAPADTTPNQSAASNDPNHGWGTWPNPQEPDE